jgi:hypothetical protein
MTDDQKSPERTVDPGPPAEGGRGRGDESLADEKGPAQADAEDPTMGGTSDGDTSE